MQTQAPPLPSKLVQFPGLDGVTPEDEQSSFESVRLTREQWLMKFRLLDGVPINFEQQPWAVDILNCMAPRQVLRTGRQVSKSTGMVNDILINSCTKPYFRSLYVAPTDEQVRVFSNDRLRPAIHLSPDIAALFFDRKTCDNQVHNRSYTIGSKTTLRSCYHDADGVRGNSSDKVYIDEMQDILLDCVPVIEATAARAKYRPPQYLYGGTPKTFDTALEHYMGRSTQNEWLVPCNHCGPEKKKTAGWRFWNILGEDNIGEEGLVCKRCGESIDWTQGEWHARYPEARWVGWHVSQLMCVQPVGWIEWAELLDFYKNGKRNVFLNEALGEPADSAAKPITIEQIKDCCRNEISFVNPVEFRTGSIPTFAGLDWAMEASSFSSYTVLVVYGLVNQRLRLLYAKRYVGSEAGKPEQILQDVYRKIGQFGCSLVGCDYGVGHMENLRLRDLLGPSADGKHRVLEYSYTESNTEIKWDAERQVFNLDRTSRMDRIFEGIKNKGYEFPKWDQFEPWHKDIYTIYTDYNKIRRRRRLLHNDPDDFFHATLFCTEAVNFFYGGQFRMAA